VMSLFFNPLKQNHSLEPNFLTGFSRKPYPLYLLVGRLADPSLALSMTGKKNSIKISDWLFTKNH